MTTPATQYYTSGPANIWTGSVPFTASNWSSYTATNWNFVGFTRSGMNVQIVPQFEDIEVDYAGRVPGEVQFLGQEARASGILTRYNDPIIQNLAAFLNKGNTNTTPGMMGHGDMGSLMGTEGYYYPILLYSPYGFKSAYSAASGPMIPGFLFYRSYLSDPYDFTLSIRAKMPSLAFRAVPYFGSFVSGTFTPDAAPFDAGALYTNTMPNPMPTAD